MTEHDFEDLARIWREQGSSSDADMRVLAGKARRQARLMSYGDIAWAVLIAGSVVAATLFNPTPLSIGIGVATLAAVLWINWRRRALRKQVTQAVDRIEFVEASIRIAKNGLRRVTFSLVTFPPAILLAILFRVTTKGGAAGMGVLEAIADWAGSPRGLIAIAVLAALVAWMIRSRRRLRAELAELGQLQLAYEEEALRDAAEGA